MAGNLPHACGHCVNCDSVKEGDIMTTRPWRPISPLPLQPAHNFSQEDELRRQWLNHRTRAQDAGLAALQQFEQQLHRRWAIETGIIEGLYPLDEAQTLTLIEHGFEPSAMRHRPGSGQPAGHPTGPPDRPRCPKGTSPAAAFPSATTPSARSTR